MMPYELMLFFVLLNILHPFALEYDGFTDSSLLDMPGSFNADTVMTPPVFTVKNAAPVFVVLMDGSTTYIVLQLMALPLVEMTMELCVEEPQ